jgi:hypothetical protein
MTNTETHASSPSDIQDALLMFFDGCGEDSIATSITDQVVGARSFDEAMVMTRDAGLVIKLANGDEFQITIVQSR